MKLNIKDEWETISKIKEGYSIARYGDGELKLCAGEKCISQIADSNLQERLKFILQTEENTKCLVGIPPVYNEVRTGPKGSKKYEFWSNFKKKDKYRKFYNSQKQYYSSFITRPDNHPHLLKNEYFEEFRSIWEGRDVILVYGDRERFVKRDFFDNANIYGEIKSNRTNAWEDYPHVITRCLGFDLDKLFLLGLGATATVLAHDLSQRGYQAVDIGHFGMIYNGYLKGNYNE